MNTASRVQNLDKAVCISLPVNNFRKGMNPSFPTKNNVGRLGYLVLWVGYFFVSNKLE